MIIDEEERLSRAERIGAFWVKVYGGMRTVQLSTSIDGRSGHFSLLGVPDRDYRTDLGHGLMIARAIRSVSENGLRGLEISEGTAGVIWARTGPEVLPVYVRIEYPDRDREFLVDRKWIDLQADDVVERVRQALVFNVMES